MRIDYAYTAAGEADVVTRFADLAGTTKVGITAYGYDAAGRVTGIEHKSGSGGSLADYDYAYDDAGRLTSKTENSVVTLFGYDDAGQLTADGSAAFAYDGFGNRVHRLQCNGSLAIVSDVRYAVDGWDPAKPPALGTEGFDTVADMDGTNTVINRRGFGPGIDDPQAKLGMGGVVTWYTTDHLGSVRQLFDNSATLTGTRDYTAFGAATIAGVGDRYAYSGRELDAASGLERHGVREYVPSIGRWTSEDPWGVWAGDTNLHRYVGNTPTGFTDPSGYMGEGQGRVGGGGHFELLPDFGGGGGGMQLLPGDGEVPPWEPMLWSGPDRAGDIREAWEGQFRGRDPREGDFGWLEQLRGRDRWHLEIAGGPGAIELPKPPGGMGEPSTMSETLPSAPPLGSEPAPGGTLGVNGGRSLLGRARGAYLEFGPWGQSTRIAGGLVSVGKQYWAVGGKIADGDFEGAARAWAGYVIGMGAEGGRQYSFGGIPMLLGANQFWGGIDGIATDMDPDAAKRGKAAFPVLDAVFQVGTLGLGGVKPPAVPIKPMNVKGAGAIGNAEHAGAKVSGDFNKSGAWLKNADQAKAAFSAVSGISKMLRMISPGIF